jgi:hypothetical protein
MARRPAISPEMTAELRRLLARGMSKRAIATRLGVSETTVYRCLVASRAGAQRIRAGASAQAAPAGRSRRRRASAARPEGGDDGYPEALLRRVPRDYLAMLPREHYLALVRAAGSCRTPAARASLRQALLLHGEPVIPPPTGIELALSPAEEEELMRNGGRFAESPAA